MSNKGDLIFDPFMGVGSAGVAALAHKRKFLGAEIDKKYIHEAKKRISDFIIKYEWKNISEIILNGFGLESNNLFEIHPEMPSIGRQVNLSVEWHFRD